VAGDAPPVVERLPGYRVGKEEAVAGGGERESGRAVADAAAYVDRRLLRPRFLRGGERGGERGGDQRKNSGEKFDPWVSWWQSMQRRHTEPGD
jgi:hypothetical protein